MTEALLEKAKKVVRSCETPEQFEAAGNYIRLARDKAWQWHTITMLTYMLGFCSGAAMYGKKAAKDRQTKQIKGGEDGR